MVCAPGRERAFGGAKSDSLDNSPAARHGIKKQCTRRQWLAIACRVGAAEVRELLGDTTAQTSTVESSGCDRGTSLHRLAINMSHAKHLQDASRCTQIHAFHRPVRRRSPVSSLAPGTSCSGSPENCPMASISDGPPRLLMDCSTATGRGLLGCPADCPPLDATGNRADGPIALPSVPVMWLLPPMLDISGTASCTL